MPSEPKDPPPATVSRPLRSNQLRKQPEIEEVDEEDTSPSSDQSDSTITAGESLTGGKGKWEEYKFKYLTNQTQGLK